MLPFRLRILFWSIASRTQQMSGSRWLWRYWQHDETGNVTILAFWRNPGDGWRRVKWKNID